MNLKFFSVGLALICLCGISRAQNPDLPTPRKYIAYKAPEKIIIDGKADEVSWQKASWSADFIDIEGALTPKYKTNMKILWDDNYLYFFAKLEEPQVWATLKQRDTVIFYNNDFEIFIDPDGDTHNYMEFEMNALNTVWDLFLTKPYRDHGNVLDSWDIQGLKTAVHVDGSINDPSDTDLGWSVEIAMPWSVITEPAATSAVPVDHFWRMGFSRVNWKFDLINGKYYRKKDGNGKFLPEYNWVWSPQWVINMHEPERWGYVYFSSNTVGHETTFNIPQDEKIKWGLYALYRKQKKHFATTGKWITSRDDLVKKPFLVEGIQLDPKLEMHQAGWNLSVKSPFTGRLLLGREDGKFVVE
ncbi:carbohydrate-binding family 9-like protein [Flavobacteriaceae bacterium F89]|uniref:Carbohydrate-binding family 9-like protein n=1 Tax=Cerina litoralis TaxID=2874477 RepID=A0AAE3ESK3_9FLAO|nr:carbohydrate-binding family 9-like protein [Cerina litoralis]MCG2459678.1 carbohydrate-binding family 9-like protein [Cerina litoralis]